MKHLIIFLLLISSMKTQAQSGSVDSLFATPTNLTDQQANEAKTFQHSGKTQRILDEKCKDKNLNNCDASTIDSSGVVLRGDFGATIEQNIGKLYGVLFGGLGFLGGDGAKVKVQNKPQTDPQDKTNSATKSSESELKSDYCGYAAVGYEALAATLQAFLQKRGSDSTAMVNDAQVQALASLYETHKARKKTATIQASVYGATAACYITRATGALDKGKVVLDWKYWAKMSASTGLATLYGLKADKHAKAMKAVKAVIDSLPKEGQCNPWTDTACFCAEATSKANYPTQYQEVCELNQGDIETPKVAIGCAIKDSKNQLAIDESCNCKKTNTCVKTTIKGYNPKFNFGANFMNQANKGFDMISSGSFDQGQFDAYNLQNGVMAAKIKNNFTAKVPKINLTDNQKKTSEDFKDLLPPALTSLAAITPSYAPTAGGLMGDSSGAALAKLPEDLKKKIDAIEAVKYKSTGAGFGSVSETEENFQMPVVPGEATQQDSTEVLSFAEQAVSKADVSNVPETPIFDIISNRYRRSGWTKLQAEETK